MLDDWWDIGLEEKSTANSGAQTDGTVPEPPRKGHAASNTGYVMLDMMAAMASEPYERFEAIRSLQELLDAHEHIAALAIGALEALT